MTEHWSWLTGSPAAEYTYSPPTRPSRPPQRPLVKLATSAHLHTIARSLYRAYPAMCDGWGNFTSGLSAEVLEEFQHFWREDFEVVHRELGCAIICMSNKFSLLQDDSRMHHVNMHDYVKGFPNGELLSEKLVELIHNCEKKYDSITDDCDRVVKVAACFKVDAKGADIAPEVAMIEAVMEKY